MGGDHPFRMAALKVYPCIAHVTSPLAQRYSLKRMSSSLMRDESDVSGRAITDGSAGPMPVLPLAALGVALLNTLRRVTNSPYSFIVLLHRIYYCIFICAVTPEGVFFFSKSTLKFLGDTCGSEANAAPELKIQSAINEESQTWAIITKAFLVNLPGNPRVSNSSLPFAFPSFRH